MPEDIGDVAQPLADLSALDAADDGAAPVRRLRQVLIGCANCRKTIKVPESRFGRTMACPSCGTLLKVDNFNLGRKSGDLIDLTHLELEPADPLADDDGFGSTVGGSSASFGTAGGSTYALADPGGSKSGGSKSGGSKSGGSLPGAGGGLGSANSQSQMRELRELNDLKHAGAISNDEYRQRKAEIYAGKTLAVQAMSRSADGSGGNRPVLGRAESNALLPKPVVALLAVVVLGGAGFAVWATVLQPPADPPAAPAPALVAAAPETPEAAPDPEPVVEAETVEATAATPPTEAVEDEPPAEADAADDPGPALPRTMMVGLDPVEGSVSVAGTGPVMAVGRWDVEFPDYTPSGDTAIAKACDVVKRIAVRDDTALIGVAVGPPVTSLDDPAYQTFRRRMTDVFTDHATATRQLGDLVMRDSESTAAFNGVQMHRLHVTSRRDRNARATILTGVQNGQAVSYWFAGHRRLYARFVGTVGRAQLVPIS
ncbi:MAG: SHOCT domain-containing protein [Planctomycetota bacterium]